jgi:hypothetical protein
MVYFSSPSPSPPQILHLFWGSHILLSTGYLGAVSPWEAEANGSPASIAEVKNFWSYTSTPSYLLLASYLRKHRDNFTFSPCVYLLIYFEGIFEFRSEFQAEVI